MKSKAMEASLDSLTQATFGRSRSDRLANKSCVSCGGKAEEFRDAISLKEYQISCLCQKCQDSVFGA